jgi:hypothetical protein
VSAGADTALTKPVEFDQLLNHINRLISPQLSLATTGT